MIGAPKRVYVDLDDVICETAVDLLKLLQEAFGRRVEMAALTSWDLGICLGLDKDEVARFLQLAHEPAVLQSHLPRPGAIEQLTTWQRVGVEVWVVTGRPTSTYTATRNWLKDQQVPHTRLAFADKYGNTGGRRAMTDGVEAMPMHELAGLGFDLAVEDSADVASLLHDELSIPVALMDQPWNHHLQQGERLRRCENWDDVDRLCGGAFTTDTVGP